eukprot:TRINITY_DN34841_c0_g2_i1.p1 TRINITY_DN34841_c0_g2~~TRINITY_DN34841_c0_g2_i1.p1  ORF type:complete len:768 (+),score=146.33 TRINITY_DN34841_c0_g2_i1:70-2373(+)
MDELLPKAEWLENRKQSWTPVSTSELDILDFDVRLSGLFEEIRCLVHRECGRAASRGHQKLVEVTTDELKGCRAPMSDKGDFVRQTPKPETEHLDCADVPPIAGQVALQSIARSTTTVVDRQAIDKPVEVVAEEATKDVPAQNGDCSMSQRTPISELGDIVLHDVTQETSAVVEPVISDEVNGASSGLVKHATSGVVKHATSKTIKWDVEPEKSYGNMKTMVTDVANFQKNDAHDRNHKAGGTSDDRGSHGGIRASHYGGGSTKRRRYSSHVVGSTFQVEVFEDHSSCGNNALQELVEAARVLADSDPKIKGTPSHKSSVDRQLQASQEKVHFVNTVIDPIVITVILINTVIIGLSTDHDRNWEGWQVVDLCFLVCYSVEAMVKMIILGCQIYFFGPSAWWNRFDFFLVITAALDAILTMATKDNNDGSPSLIILRTLRMTRFGRILRLLHFSIFKELLTMLSGLLSGLRTLLWAFVLLAFPIYAIGLVLTDMLGHGKARGDLVEEHFGTLPRSMFTVYRCSIGDCSMSNGTPAIQLLIRNYGWLYGVGYICVTMLVTFGIFNLIMATFVDNALSSARRNEVLRMRTRLTDMNRQGRIVSQFIEKLWEHIHPDVPQLDVDMALNMTITQEQLNEVFDDDEVQKLLVELDVPEDDRRGLFDVLDADGGGTLQLDELIGGIIKLRGDPRRSDVVQVALVLRSLQTEFREFSTEVIEYIRTHRTHASTVAPRMHKTIPGLADINTSNSNPSIAAKHMANYFQSRTFEVVA